MLKKRKRHLLYLTVPGLLLIFLFIIIPLMNGVRIAFYRWNGYSQNMKFVGLDNFISLASDRRLMRTTVNTLIYGFGSCALQNILGLAAALFVSRKFFGRDTMRAVIYMPVMISGYVLGQIFSYMFMFENGVFNDLLAVFGMAPVNWLGNGWTNVLIVTIINSWQYLGLCMLIYLAGLQGIPSSYLEAATIDGASPGQIFFKVKIPLLIPSITTCVVTNLIGGLKLFEMVTGLTGGGPDRQSMSLSQYIQLLYFTDEKAGYSAAVGIFMFVLIFAIAMPINHFLRKREVSM